MCPVCIGNVTLIAAGASSSGGLTAFAVKKIFWKAERNIRQTKLEESK